MIATTLRINLRSAAKFTHPNDSGGLKQSASLEVQNQLAPATVQSLAESLDGGKVVSVAVP